MANSITHTHLVCIKNTRFTVPLEFRKKTDSTLSTPTSPSAKYSTDGSYPSNACSNTVTGTSGVDILTLTGAETNNKALFVAVESTDCFTVLLYVSIWNGPIVGSGTLSAGSSGGGTLGTILPYDLTGCWIRTTGGTGGGGTGGANNQARRIVTYNTSTGAFTCDTWETTPSTDTTYDIVLPENITLGLLKTLNPTTAGNTLDVSSGGEAGLDWANIGSKTTTNALTGTTVATTQQVDLNTIKTQTVTCSGGVTVPAATLASTTNITAGTITTVTNLTNAPTAGDLTSTMKTSVQTAADAAVTANALVNAIAGYIDTEVAAIKAKTDQLVFTNANKVDASLQAAADIATAVANKLADIIRRRTQANVEASAYGDTLDKSSLYGFIQQAQESNTTASAGNLTIYKTDGSTSLGTLTLSSDSGAAPITGAS